MSVIVSAFTATASAFPAFSLACASAQLAPLSFMSRCRSATGSPLQILVVDCPVAELANASATRLPRTTPVLTCLTFILPPFGLGPRRRGLLLRRRDAEGRVARSTGVTTERPDRRRHGRGVLRERLIAKRAGAVFEVLRGGLELRPLLPDVGLRLRLVGERALGEQERDPLSVERERLGIHRDTLRVARFDLVLDLRPVGAVVLHQPLAVRDGIAGPHGGRLAGRAADDGQRDEAPEDDTGPHVSELHLVSSFSRFHLGRFHPVVEGHCAPLPILFLTAGIVLRYR